MAHLDKFRMDLVIKLFEKRKIDVPIMVANEGKKYFVASWQRQGWDGKPWEQVQRRIEGTDEYRWPKKTRLSRRTNPILVGVARAQSGGRLRRSANNSIREANWRRIRWATDVAYAKAHNEGTSTAGRGHNTTIAQRKFMGYGVQIRSIIKETIRKEIIKIF